MSASGHDSHADDAARWPMGSMLFIGTFGARHSAAGRRYHSRVWLALGAYVGLLIAFGVQGRHESLWLLPLCGATVTFLAYEMWRYVSGLDELARRLQLEAMAITYLIGFVAFFALAVTPLKLNPGYFIVLEPVRGLVLAWRARRYS